MVLLNEKLKKQIEQSDLQKKLIKELKEKIEYLNTNKTTENVNILNQYKKNIKLSENDNESSDELALPPQKRKQKI